MGLPDGADTEPYAELLKAAADRGLPVFCTNPDRASPRAHGVTVASPGALAHAHADAGGIVRFYGKPHLPVFRAVETALGLPPWRMLMVGDSLEHDIAGAKAAGWDAAFVEGGPCRSLRRGDRTRADRRPAGPHQWRAAPRLYPPRASLTCPRSLPIYLPSARFPPASARTRCGFRGRAAIPRSRTAR